MTKTKLAPPARRTPPAPRVLRCACYTRKSTEEGLEQEFNSLDAQARSRRSASSKPNVLKVTNNALCPLRRALIGFTGNRNMVRPG